MEKFRRHRGMCQRKTYRRKSLKFIVTNCKDRQTINYNYLHPNIRSSRPEVFCEKGALKIFTKRTEKHLCQVSFQIKLQASGNFIKRSFGAGVFICYRTPPVAAFWIRFRLDCLLLFLRFPLLTIVVLQIFEIQILIINNRNPKEDVKSVII